MTARYAGRSQADPAGQPIEVVRPRRDDVDRDVRAVLTPPLDNLARA